MPTSCYKVTELQLSVSLGLTFFLFDLILQMVEVNRNTVVDFAVCLVLLQWPQPVFRDCCVQVLCRKIFCKFIILLL